MLATKLNQLQKKLAEFQNSETAKLVGIIPTLRSAEDINVALGEPCVTYRVNSHPEDKGDWVSVTCMGYREVFKYSSAPSSGWDEKAKATDFVDELFYEWIVSYRASQKPPKRRPLPESDA